ncbi:MAG: NAD(P)-dependent alcohol dehydrogenase, partial [Nannocystaceae bacterium]
MKAAIHTHYGPPNVLRIQDVSPPRVGDHQVLIEVHAVPLTEGDRRLRSADFPGINAIAGRLMFGVFRPRRGLPGTNFAGRVIAIGSAVTRFAVGEDVFGSCLYGACAQQLTVDENSPIAKIPEGFDYDEAAAIPYGAGTALAFLRDVAKVQPGERVLIVGAAGGVGRFAVQVARHLGAEVTGVCRGPDVELVRKLGASTVIDYQLEDFTDNGESYDVIFDTADGGRFNACRGSLNKGGRYVSVYLDTRMLVQMLVTSVFGDRKATSSVV